MEETSVVGLFSQSASSLGVQEMIGNVWEWKSSAWGQGSDKPQYGYPYKSDDGREDLKTLDIRLLRGGSWIISSRNARSAYRNRNIPDAYDLNVGFRIVLVSLGNSES